jgi:hypothetical protein
MHIAEAVGDIIAKLAPLIITYSIALLAPTDLGVALTIMSRLSPKVLCSTRLLMDGDNDQGVEHDIASLLRMHLLITPGLVIRVSVLRLDEERKEQEEEEEEEEEEGVRTTTTTTTTTTTNPICAMCLRIPSLSPLHGPTTNVITFECVIQSDSQLGILLAQGLVIHYYDYRSNEWSEHDTVVDSVCPFQHDISSLSCICQLPLSPIPTDLIGRQRPPIVC